MIRQKWVNKLISDVAKKMNLPDYVVEEIFTSQFKFLKEVISKSKEEEKPPVIMLNYWGKYYPSMRKIKYIKTRNESREKKNTNIPQTS
jgi:hypothetical protein